MVLKNSKWDKKAKYKYMKKHGILPKKNKNDNEENQGLSRPKWSSKKKTIDNQEKIILEDSEDEWDSDVDEALINHFYPQLSENEELTIEQKIKIKQQILTDIAQQQEQEENSDSHDEKEEELDGIYLGSEENKHEEMKSESKEPAKFNLQEFMDNLEIKPKKNRKMLKNKMSDNFLEDYGLTSYKDLNRNQDDYNDLYIKKQQEKIKSSINYIPNDKLDGFVIGESTVSMINDKSKPNNTKSDIRQLTEEEKQQDEERQKLVEQQLFYNNIRNKFDDVQQQKKPKAKIIDINNFNNNDLGKLNDKISKDRATTDLDSDIDFLLGIEGKSNESADTAGNSSKKELDFLDELLG